MPEVTANAPGQPGFPRKQAPAKLTRAKAQRFEAHIAKTYAGVAFDLTVTRGLLRTDMIELTRIIVPDRKRGTGTAIMRELCAFADRHAVGIRLTPASKGDYAVTTSRGRLIRFYKRFGFVEEKPRHGDFRQVPVMMRASRFSESA